MTPSPGRSCPIDYRYGPTALRHAPSLDADALWIAGGLYGNTEALRALQALVDAEAVGRVALVFNGDFHWFDVAPAEFATVQAAALRAHAMRGNVETELAREGDDAAAGCGCAYPDSVPQEDVDRSNAMAASLRETARAVGAADALRGLPVSQLKSNLASIIRAAQARGITVSMSRKGDCWDNAPMESVNGTLKVECVHGQHFRTREQARQAIVEYIGYYNTERRHSSLGNPPCQYDLRHLPLIIQ
jgi:hypothetical protein